MCDPELLPDLLEDELQADLVRLAAAQRPREALLRVLREAVRVAFPVVKEEDPAYQSSLVARFNPPAELLDHVREYALFKALPGYQRHNLTNSCPKTTRR